MLRYTSIVEEVPNDRHDQRVGENVFATDCSIVSLHYGVIGWGAVLGFVLSSSTVVTAYLRRCNCDNSVFATHYW